jgi:ATP-dependent Clp protease adaptor protein ClpS
MTGITVHLCSSRLQVATKTAEEKLIRLRSQLLRPWHVILHNDDVHLADDVASWLVASVPGLSSQDAWLITLQAHNTGQAVIITCPKEEAELYQERLQSYGLTITIEKAE